MTLPGIFLRTRDRRPPLSSTRRVSPAASRCALRRSWSSSSQNTDQPTTVRPIKSDESLRGEWQTVYPRPTEGQRARCQRAMVEDSPAAPSTLILNVSHLPGLRATLQGIGSSLGLPPRSLRDGRLGRWSTCEHVVSQGRLAAKGLWNTSTTAAARPTAHDDVILSRLHTQFK